MEQLYGISDLATALGCGRTDAYLQVQAALAGPPTAPWWLLPASYRTKGDPPRSVFFRRPDRRRPAHGRLIPAARPPLARKPRMC